MSELQYLLQIVHVLVNAQWLKIWLPIIISGCAVFLTYLNKQTSDSKEADIMIRENMKKSYEVFDKVLNSDFKNDCIEWHNAIIRLKDMDSFLPNIKTKVYKKNCINRYKDFYNQLHCLLNNKHIDANFFYGKKLGEQNVDLEAIQMTRTFGSEIDVVCPINIDLLQYLNNNMRGMSNLDVIKSSRCGFHSKTNSRFKYIMKIIQTKEYKNTLSGFCFQADQYIKCRSQEPSCVKEEGVSKDAEVV